MKSIKQFATIAFLALLVSFASCSNDDNKSSIPFAKEGTITAQVDGKIITTLPLDTEGFIYIKNENSGTFYLKGNVTENEGFLFTMADYKGPGTYIIDGANGSNQSSFMYFDNQVNPKKFLEWTARYDIANTTGKLIVTEQTATKMKGTFTFKGKGSGEIPFLEITNGSFDVNLMD